MPTIDKISQLNRAIEYAKSRGGECLSTEYINNSKPLSWKCGVENHPVWETPFFIVNRGGWCPLCGLESRREKRTLSNGLERAQDYAKSRGGECLSTEYTKAKDKMLWKCDNPNHPEWQGTFDTVVLKGSWCVHCARNRVAQKYKLSNGLERAQEYARSKNGKCLSTEYINAREPMIWKCDNQEHPIWQSNFDHVVSRDRWCQQCAYDKAIMPDGFKKAQAYAKKQGGQCLTPPDTPIKKHSYLLWKCDDETHPAWESLYHGIVELKTWCPRCAGKFTPEEYLEKAKNYAEVKGGKCLSTEYVDQRTDMEWKCEDDSHPFWISPYKNVVARDLWCPKCRDIFTPEEYLQKAKDYAITRGGQCLATEYIAQIEPLDWECINHGIFKSDYVNIVLNNRWCPHCWKEARDNTLFQKVKDYAKK